MGWQLVGSMGQKVGKTTYDSTDETGPMQETSYEQSLPPSLSSTVTKTSWPLYEYELKVERLG